MPLTNQDRFAQGAARRIQIGDRARLPLALGRGLPPYERDWEVVAFGGVSVARTPITRYHGNGQPFRTCRLDRDCQRHLITIRRLHDGLTRTIGQDIWVFHADLGGRTFPNRSARRRQGMTLEHARLTVDRMVGAAVRSENPIRIQHATAARHWVARWLAAA